MKVMATAACCVGALALVGGWMYARSDTDGTRDAANTFVTWVQAEPVKARNAFAAAITRCVPEQVRAQTKDPQVLTATAEIVSYSVYLAPGRAATDSEQDKVKKFAMARTSKFNERQQKAFMGLFQDGMGAAGVLACTIRDAAAQAPSQT